MPLQIRYEGRDFGTTSLELTIDEPAAVHHDLLAPEGIHLAAFAIDPPRLVSCLNDPYQIAQKLHALPQGNDRGRDIVDIWLLEALLETGGLLAVKSAAVETFQRRAKHPWPPRIASSPFWARDYDALVTEYLDAPQKVEAALAYLTDLIARIDQS